MSRRPASITQADVARVIRAAKQAGAAEVEMSADFIAIAEKIGGMLIYPSRRDHRRIVLQIAKPGPELTALYRHYDRSGSLLYVGISLDPVRRLRQHIGSRWYSLIAKIEIEQFYSRREALEAEALAIVAEHPVFNIAGRATRK